MQAGTRTKGRLGLITGAAAVIAVLAVLLLGGLSVPSVSPSSAGPAASSHARPFVIPATTIFVNRSQTGGTYIYEAITVNNSSSLVQLPHSFTGVNGCRWISVVNLTTNLDALDAVSYVNVTGANNSGTALAKNALTTGFDICGGHQAWVNYQKFSFDIYTFSFATLGANANLTFVNYSSGGAVITVNKNFTILAGGSVALKVWTNETFTVRYPASATGTLSCSVFGVCTTPSWAFTSASTALPIANTTTKTTAKFLSIGSTGYRNWTVYYTESNATSTTGGGAFVVAVGGFWTTWIVPFWWAWTLLIIAIVVVAAASASRHRAR